MKTLAIKGDEKRGNEVIDLLKMLGGKNIYGYICTEQDELYMIDDELIIKTYDWNNCVIFTLDEFYKKYPYRVGDKVVYTKFGDNCDDYPVTIESMEWTGTTIEYTFNDCVTCLAKDLKMWNGEPDAVISGIYLNSCDYADEVELYLGDYEIEVRDGKTYAVKKKPVYPQNYKECCSVLGFNNAYDLNNIATHDVVYDYKLQNFYRLLICRNAYWKIVGEQMALDKPWEPIYTNLSNDIKYVIEVNKGILTRSTCADVNKFLIFPTAEMCDTFLENFRELIESCKEFI